MDTLFLSDMDGTLFNRSSPVVSPQSAQILRNLIEGGMLFSVATARSIHKALPLIEPLHIRIPVILMNGAILYDPVQARVLRLSKISRGHVALAVNIISNAGYVPLLYTLGRGQKERVYYLKKPGYRYSAHLKSRLSQGDSRFRAVDDYDVPTKTHDCFYVTASGAEPEMRRLSEKLRGAGITHHFYYDIYTEDFFIECCPEGMDKGCAAKELKQMLGVERLVVFGDNHNDISMFMTADESYATADALEDVRAKATGIIGPSGRDGVAMYLLGRN